MNIRENTVSKLLDSNLHENGPPPSALINSKNQTSLEAVLQFDTGIVHDWLPTIAGAEAVLKNIAQVVRDGHIYTLFDFLTEDERHYVTQGLPLSVSNLNDLPGVQRYYRYLLISCTRAIERFDVTRHELVISASAALAKGVITAPEQKHMAYIHSPARYAWDLTHEYLDNLQGPLAFLKRNLAHRMFHQFRMWDMRTVAQIDHIVANSNFIRKRIWKTYRRDAQVIYPPVDTTRFSVGNVAREDFYFTASRMVPYKQILLIVETFAQRPDLRLIVAGSGPDMAKVRAAATPNVTVLGRLTFDEMRSHMQRARAFVFAAREDFGIIPVEAQACGCPVIALSHGGTAETIRDISRSDPTGVWFGEQTSASLGQAINTMEAEYGGITSQACRTNAQRFSAETFRLKIVEAANNVMASTHI